MLYGQPNFDLSVKREEDEEDIDDDNREDNDEDDEDDETFVKSKQNGFSQSELKETQNNYDFYLDSVSRSSNGDNIDIERENDIDILNNSRNNEINQNTGSVKSHKSNSRRQSKNFHYSPDTTDYDSNYGDFDSESSLRFLATEYGANVPIINQTTSQTINLNCPNVNNYGRYYASMPVLEDGLSSGHTSDTENNNNPVTIVNTNDFNAANKRGISSNNNSTNLISNTPTNNLPNSPVSYQDNLVQTNNIMTNNNNNFYGNPNPNQIIVTNNETEDKLFQPMAPVIQQQQQQLLQQHYHPYYPIRNENKDLSNSTANSLMNNKIFKNRDPELESLYTISKINFTSIFFIKNSI
jgi:hypothetical protein